MEKKILFKDRYLTFSHYKEPLLKIPRGKGFGYYGALLGTVEGDKIQCHICGKLYKNIGGHIFNTHKILKNQYKTMFKLAFSTALVSEDQRMALKQRTLDWLKTLTPEQKLAYKLKSKERCKKRFASMTRQEIYKMMSHPKQLETDNKRGTCPDQLLDKIKQVIKKLGRVPSSKEFVKECGTQRYKHLIFKVFGSWNNALKMIGEQPKKPSRHYEKEELLNYLLM